MSKDLMTALGAGALSALASMAFLSGIPGALLIVYVAPLPLLMAGLALGLSAASLAVMVGIVVAGLIGGPMASILFAIIHGLPVWMITRLSLLRQIHPDGTPGAFYPHGFILALVSAYAAGGFLIVLLMAPSQEGGLMGMITAYLGEIFSFMLPTLDDATLNEMIDAVVPLFPGYMGISWLIMVTINTSIATALLARANRLPRPVMQMSKLILPDWLSWLLIASAAIALVGSGETQFLGRNLALILALPFFFLGLSLVHIIARKTTFPGTFLAGFYVFLVLIGWIALLVIVAGLTEQWVGLRSRLNQSNNV